jgi:hypothetical protein
MIFEELLLLSHNHMEAVVKEDWTNWESIYQRKEQLFKGLENTQLSVEENEILSKIRLLEKQVESELLKKREETRESLIQLKQTRNGIKGYRRGRMNASKRHFSIKI